MAEKRSLSEALTLTPEKVSFIQDASISPSQPNGAAATPREPAVSNDNRSEKTISVPHVRTVDGTASPGVVLGPTLVSITTRLRQETHAALRRAYLEHKLSRKLPDTQQEIIEEALQHWLYEHGFLC